MAAERFINFEASPNSVIRCRKGRAIFRQGEPSGLIYRVEQGCVRLQVDSEAGERQIVAFLLPGDVFGYGRGPRNCTAEAASDAVVRSFPVRRLFEPDMESESSALELVDSASTLYGELAAHLARISGLPAHDRVMWFFDWLLGQPSALGGSGQELVVPISQKDMADYLGLAPESLSRCLRQLEARDQIRRRGRRRYWVRPNRGTSWDREDLPTEAAG